MEASLNKNRKELLFIISLEGNLTYSSALSGNTQPKHERNQLTLNRCFNKSVIVCFGYVFSFGFS